MLYYVISYNTIYNNTIYFIIQYHGITGGILLSRSTESFQEPRRKSGYHYVTSRPRRRKTVISSLSDHSSL